MGGASLFAGAFAAANAVAEGLGILQDVVHVPWIGAANGVGDEVAGAPSIALRALVQKDPAISRTTRGQEVKLRAIVTFLEPPAPHGAPGRQEPIDPRDRILLDDGTTAPIVDVKDGLTNSETGQPFAVQVWLGRIGRD
jgi:hypothetical protein